jgi:hypothetical protein
MANRSFEDVAKLKYLGTLIEACMKRLRAD